MSIDWSKRQITETIEKTTIGVATSITYGGGTIQVGGKLTTHGFDLQVPIPDIIVELSDEEQGIRISPKVSS